MSRAEMESKTIGQIKLIKEALIDNGMLDTTERLEREKKGLKDVQGDTKIKVGCDVANTSSPCIQNIGE